MRRLTVCAGLAAAQLAAVLLLGGCKPKNAEKVASDLRPVDLRCEYLTNPVGVDEHAPRLSWQVAGDSAVRGQVQRGYRILVASSRALLEQDRGDLWDSREASSATAQIAYAGRPLSAEQKVYWKVRVTDGRNRRSPWSAVATWSEGLLAARNWHARWIGCDAIKPSHAAWLPPAQPGRTYLPATYLRKDFTLSQKPKRAVLYVTALGAVEPRLNGRLVADHYLDPGWTDYRKRLYYRAYDVTALLRQGANTLAAVLGDGWFRGNIGSFGQDRYGKHTRLREELHLFEADGSVKVVSTDSTWKVGTGPVLEGDIQAGESYDARLEQPGWDKPGFNDRAWRSPDLGAEVSPAILSSHPGPAVHCVGERTTVAVTEPKPGVYVFDLGQNFAGIARLKVDEPACTVIRMRFAEMLKADGTGYFANLRTARATDTYVCRGGGVETWSPRFTYHGFRYVQVEGLTSRPAPDTITGLVMSSLDAPTGGFASSNALLNQLWSNVRWGELSNYMDVPTDCPQRDERLGWTGDAQVFVRTAAYNEDIAAFMTKWVDDLADTQGADGQINDTAPVGFVGSNAGWADAGIIIPWTLWHVYGDTRILERHYDMMKRYLAYCRTQCSADLVGPDRGYGDWLAIGGTTGKSLISTAYFAHCTELMADIAGALGRTKDEATYRALFAQVCASFQKHFINPDGSIGAHKSQTAHLLALRFGLLTPAQRKAAIPHFINSVEKRNWRLGVGFLGVNLLLPTLTDVGCTQGAYYVVTGREFPSWGYSIDQGATTVWERWNSYTKASGFGDSGMNSFNHYAYGSCGEWLYRTVLGIGALSPGFSRISIHPEPGPGVTWARGHYDSIRGRIETSWKLENGRFSLDVVLPPNTAADVYLPAKAATDVTEGGAAVASVAAVRFLRQGDDEVVFEVGSGRYHFECPYAGPAHLFPPPVPGKDNAAEEERGPARVKETPGSYSIQTKIGVLMANPATRAVLQKFFPEAIANPQFEQAMGTTLFALHDFSPDYFSTTKLDAVEAALAKIPRQVWSVETTKIGALLDNPKTRAILERYLPEAVANPQFAQARGSTLRFVQGFSPDYFTSAKLQAIADAFAKLNGEPPAAKAKSEPTPAPAPATPSAALGIDSKIGALLDDPASRAILHKYLGAMIDSPQFAGAHGITLEQLKPYVPQVLTEEVLKRIADDLAKLAHGPKTGASPTRKPGATALSVDTKMAVLLADSHARKVLKAALPKLMASTQINQADDLTLRELQQYFPDALTSAKLEAIDAELANLSGRSVSRPSTHYGLDTKIGALLDDPAAKAVLERSIGAMISNPQFSMARGLTLRQLQPYAKEVLSDKVLDTIAEGLAKIPSRAERRTPQASLYVPSTLSPQWQAFLHNPPFPTVRPAMHGPLDAKAWDARWRANEEAMLRYVPALLGRYKAALTDRTLGGVPVLEIHPRGWKDDGRVLVYCHGGGYTMGSARSTLYSSLLIAADTGLRVLSVDYTVAPKATWKTVTGQVVSVLEALKGEGTALNHVVICGDSAGGGLAAASVLKMRDEGRGMPAAVVLWSPWTDVSDSGETLVTLEKWDPLLSRSELRAFADAYAAPADQKNPYVSPVYGDYSKGFPPTLIQGGTREILLSDFVREYQAIKRAGMPAELDLYEGMIHVFQPMVPDSPETHEALKTMKAFIDAHVAAR